MHRAKCQCCQWCGFSGACAHSSMGRCWVAPLIPRRKAEQQGETPLRDTFTGLKLRSSFGVFIFLSNFWVKAWMRILGRYKVNSISIAFCLNFFWHLTLCSLNWWQLLSKKCRMNVYENLNGRRLSVDQNNACLKTNCYKATLFG